MGQKLAVTAAVDVNWEAGFADPAARALTVAKGETIKFRWTEKISSAMHASGLHAHATTPSVNHNRASHHATPSRTASTMMLHCVHTHARLRHSFAADHNVWKFTNKAAFDACDFASAAVVAGGDGMNNTYASYTVGETSYFGCQVRFGHSRAPRPLSLLLLSMALERAEEVAFVYAWHANVRLTATASPVHGI